MRDTVVLCLAAESPTPEHLFHVNDGDHIEIDIIESINDPIAALVSFAQTAGWKLMDRMPHLRTHADVLHALDEAGNLLLSVKLGVPGDEGSHGAQVLPGLR